MQPFYLKPGTTLVPCLFTTDIVHRKISLIFNDKNISKMAMYMCLKWMHDVMCDKLLLPNQCNEQVA